MAAASAQEVRIGAASDLQSTLPEVAQAFEQASGMKTVISYGSSGNLTSQIENGAPFDVFLSADMGFAQRAAKSAKAHGQVAAYTAGKLALAVAEGVDCARDCDSQLAQAKIAKVAIANPQHAPYGKAAMNWIESRGDRAQIRPKLVLGDSVAQALQFVVSGNAQMAVVSASLCAASKVRCEPIDAPPLQQGALVLDQGKVQAGEAFLKFLLSAPAQKIFMRHGYISASRP